MAYPFLSKQKFELGEYSIEPYREMDKVAIMNWRNDQMDVLRQKKKLTPEDQATYYENHIVKSFREDQPRIILFSFLRSGICIGYGGLTNLDWQDRRCELSFLDDSSRIANNDLYKADFSSFIKLMKLVAFEEIRFNKIFAETYDIRSHHISILEAEGFKEEGRLREHVFIQGKFEDSLIHSFLKSEYRD